MAILGGILGAVAGFTIGVLFTEVIFASSLGWTDAVPFALAVLGILTGSSLGRRVRSSRKPRPSS